MKPVDVVIMPHNYRDELYPDDPAAPRTSALEDRDKAPGRIEYLDLPIPMPERALVFTDRAGKPLAIDIDDRRIRWKDVATVWDGIQQYNDDVAAGMGEETL